jgi:hypothetical protein
MPSEYSSPKVYNLGSVKDLTSQELDKVGTSSDIATLLLPNLTGVIQPDPASTPTP